LDLGDIIVDVCYSSVHSHKTTANIMKQPFELKDINLGGIADSRYQGIANSMANIVGLDIHSEPGAIKCNQALVKDSGTTVDGPVSKILPCTDGNTYFFGKTSGKIWKRTSGGVWSLEATASPAAGSAGILDAYEFEGYIYYSMQSRLGRVAVGAPTAWAGRDDSWATFLNTNATYHPIKEKNKILYIGDGFYIAQVEGGLFTGDALDLDSTYTVTALGESGESLAIGTIIANNVNWCRVFRWNGWAISWTVDDQVPEVGIRAFIPADNLTLFAAGTKGNVYSYDGNYGQHVKRIPGIYTSTNKAVVALNAVAHFDRRPMFGISYDSGNPCLQGVYSFGGYSNNYPNVLVLDYVISTGHTANVKILSMEASGDLLFVAWQDDNGGTTYGVDVLDLSNKATGYFETRIINTDRLNGKQIGLAVPYRELPTGTSVVVKAKNNYATSWTTLTTVVDAEHMIINVDTTDLPDSQAFEVRVELVPSSNDTPVVEGLVIAI